MRFTYFYLLCLSFNCLKAQYISPIAVSNYGTAQSLFISPSLSGYSKYNWHVNLAGAWVNANNNFIGLRMPYSLYRAPNNIPERYQTENGNASFKKEWLKPLLNGNRKHLAVSAMAFGPSASVKIGRARLGVFTQGYAGIRLVGLSENLAYALYRELDSAQGAFRFFNPDNAGASNRIDKITMVAHSAAAVGLNFNYVIPLKWDRQLILGSSLKRAFGFSGAYFNGEAFSGTSNFDDTFILSPVNFTIMEFGENETAKGWGYDIGATYLFHKKDFKRNGPYAANNTQYFGKFSAAILDIGHVKYNDAFRANLNINRNYVVNTDSFGTEINANNYRTVLDSIVSANGSYTEERTAIRVGLPTRIVLSADRQLKNHFFVCATLTHSLRKRHSYDMRFQNTLMIAPRWEWAYFEVSTPLLWAYDYRAVRLGTSLRLGPLYLGSNSVLPFIYTRGFRDVDFFIGIAFGNMPNYNVSKWLEDRAKRLKSKKKAKDCPAF